jgi:predicted MFS family arabinose efflux permease
MGVPSRGSAGAIGTFAALRDRHFQVLWSSGLLATTAFMMSLMLMPALAYDITGSNASAGIATMGSGIGMVLLAPIGGVIADRVRKKRLVLAGQVVPGLVILAIGLLIVTDSISIILLTIGTMIMGVGFAFMAPARQAWVGEIVPPRLLANAIALQQIGMTAAQVVAPLCIAIIVGSLLGMGGTYLFTAGLFVVILPMTLSLPNTRPEASLADRRSVGAEMSDGARYLFGDPQLRLLWASFMAMIICGFAFQTLLPGFLDQALGRDPTDIGLIFLVFALAGLTVNLLLTRLVGTSLMWPAMLGLGVVMAVGFAVLAAAPSYGIAMIAAIPLGVGRSGFMLLNQTLLVSYTKPAYYGRVASLAMMAFGSHALLAPIWGIMADSIGIRNTLAVVGGVAGVSLLTATIVWLRFSARTQLMAAPSSAQSGS